MVFGCLRWMCQCMFTFGKTCTIMLSNVDNEKGYACVRAEGNWEISVPSSQFCYEHKTALKKFFKNIWSGWT